MPVAGTAWWQEAAGFIGGALLRRIWVPPTRVKVGGGPLPSPVIGTEAIDPGTIARIIKNPAVAAGFDRRELGNYSLKRGAITTRIDRGVHSIRFKQLGRHKSYAVLDEYLQPGDPFERHHLSGVL